MGRKGNIGGRKRRIFLVEDHPVTREGFAQLINFQSDLQVCGQASGMAPALSQIPALNADLVIVDLSLAGESGLELIKNLSSRLPHVKTLVLSAHSEWLYAERALRAGSRGYVMKNAPTHEIMSAIRQVLNGALYLSQKMSNRLVRKIAGMRSFATARSELEPLSDRELEVFMLIGEGCSTRQIGESLRLSVSTVETYRAHIKEKLGIQSGTELAQRAFDWARAGAP